MKFAIFAVLAAAALIGLSLTCWGGLWLIAAGILIGVGALAYSTGPWPLSTHCLGEVAVIIFFGIIPVNLTYYVQALQWSQIGRAWFRDREEIMVDAGQLKKQT